MFEILPRDVALYIILILIKYAGTDDVFNLAMCSHLLKRYVIHAMEYKLPEQYAGKHGPMEWALLMRGYIHEVNIPAEFDSLEEKLEFYALELSTVEKATINSIHSFLHILPRIPNLNSLTLTCDITSIKLDINSNTYIETMIVSKLSSISLGELVLSCNSPHSETGSKCIQSIIFSSIIGGKTQEWQNRSVRKLSLSYGRDCAFWNPGDREILSVFPSTKFLVCFKAPLEIPRIDGILDNLKEIHIYSNRGTLSSSSLLSDELLNKLVTLECTHVPVSGEDLKMLKDCKCLKNLKLTTADSAEESLHRFATCLQTLSISWGPCRPIVGSRAHVFYSPKNGILPSLVEMVPNLQKLCWLHAALSCEDLLTVLKRTGRRLRSLELSLEHQAVCHGQYFLRTIKWLSIYNPQIRTVNLEFCCDGRHESCRCMHESSRFEEGLSSAAKVLFKHAPLLDARAIRIAKNRIIRNHLLTGAD
ncbi:unnamed protein product [Agarophyton chilense]